VLRGGGLTVGGLEKIVHRSYAGHIFSSTGNCHIARISRDMQNAVPKKRRPLHTDCSNKCLYVIIEQRGPLRDIYILRRSIAGLQHCARINPRATKVKDAATTWGTKQRDYRNEYITDKIWTKWTSNTVRSESRCALMLRYVDLVVSIEVAVAVSCCFTVFSC
jgi:hypothetical protein